MNILSIASILPIPGIINANDFVFQTYTTYRQLFPKDRIVIIKPVKINLNPIQILRRNTDLSKLNKDFTRHFHNFRIEIIPFFSSWRFRNIHAILTYSIYYLNKKRIDTIIRNNNIDIIHAQYIIPDGLLASFISKKYYIPFLLTTHNERFYFEHTISKIIALNILNQSSLILPINYSNALYYISLGIKNIKPVPLGFKEIFLRDPKNKSDNRVSILTVAELIQLKNIDKVIYSIKQLIPKYSLLYTIIGKGPEKKNLLDLTVRLELSDYVHFIDYIPHEQIANEMYKHDIFIMPSYFETFGRVYFEAMAMGIPIICAKNSGIFGFFKNMEEGIAVNHESIDEITESLEYLISNPDKRMQMGLKGKKLVEQFTWENIARNIHKQYLKIANSEKC